MQRIIRKNVRFFSNFAKERKGEPIRNQAVAFKIRPMRTEEIPQVVELGRQSLFHYTSSALKFWHTKDPEGIIIAVTESGEIIGSVTSVKNTESLYYGGMFCVHENYRDTDVGRKVLTKSFARAQGNTLLGSVGLHQIPAFTRRGVKVIETDWNSLEYETDIPVNPSILSDELPSGVEILSFQNSLLPAVFEYDYLLVGFDRRPIIEASCKEELSKTLVAMKDGKCVGFGSIKLDIAEYRKLGPLYADDPSIAEAMAKRLITTMPEAKGFTTGTINTNLFANMILEKFNIPIHKSYYFLSTKERLLVDTKRVFAHLDLDFCPF